ncbi:MAG: division/cell wall cluster transcriptional repressor MraZ [Pseudomonadota bacterium]|jgi:MraZ protein|nr:transcriptional regulator MraZ [Pseudomonadota bacterium]
MFSGVSTLNLDGKGRLSVPSKHRDALFAQCEGRLIVTVEPSGCLLIYPEPEWAPIYEKLNALTGAQAAIKRLIIGHAEDVQLDSAGRLLISPRLRTVAKLDKEVALVGMGSKFELWDAVEWDRRTAATMAIDSDDLAAQMEGIAL